MALVSVIGYKVSHNLSLCSNPPGARKPSVSLLMTLLDGQHIRQSFSVALNSDFEILAALQRVKTVVRNQRHLLGAETFPTFAVGWTWQGFAGIWISVGLSSGL